MPRSPGADSRRSAPPEALEQLVGAPHEPHDEQYEQQRREALLERVGLGKDSQHRADCPQLHSGGSTKHCGGGLLGGGWLGGGWSAGGGCWSGGGGGGGDWCAGTFFQSRLRNRARARKPGRRWSRGPMSPESHSTFPDTVLQW